MSSNNRASVHFRQLEPDQARAYALNLLAARETFLVEIDATLVKDMIVVHRGPVVFEERRNFEYLPRRAVTFDEAAQYVVNLLRAEMAFQVTPHVLPTHCEWVIIVEIPLAAHRIEAMSERNR